jgi:hypothetical protein
MRGSISELYHGPFLSFGEFGIRQEKNSNGIFLIFTSKLWAGSISTEKENSHFGSKAKFPENQKNHCNITRCANRASYHVSHQKAK